MWPGAWREVFELLRTRGTRIEVVERVPASASIRTDLGLAQASLSAGAAASRREVRGDGTLVAVRAATSWELGEATAALLRVLVPTGRGSDALVVRAGDAAPLDAALVAQGLRAQGLTTSSALRPTQQILPLALALHYLPRDVHRALELLSLPLSPVPSKARGRLLGAPATAPPRQPPSTSASRIASSTVAVPAASTENERAKNAVSSRSSCARACACIASARAAAVCSSETRPRRSSRSESSAAGPHVGRPTLARAPPARSPRALPTIHRPSVTSMRAEDAGEAAIVEPPARAVCGRPMSEPRAALVRARWARR